MNVWVVGISNADGDSIVCVCASKELAVKKLFHVRDELVKDWEKMLQEFPYSKEMYSEMIAALSSDDYENWNNYPHDSPYIYETEVLKESADG